MKKLYFVIAATLFTSAISIPQNSVRKELPAEYRQRTLAIDNVSTDSLVIKSNELDRQLKELNAKIQ